MDQGQMGKHKIDARRVTALVAKIRNSYTDMIITLQKQKKLMEMVGETDTEPIDEAIIYFKKKETGV